MHKSISIWKGLGVLLALCLIVGAAGLRASELSSEITAYAQYEDQVTGRTGIILNLGIPPELAGMRIDRAWLLVQPTSEDTITKFQEIGCFVLSNAIASGPSVSVDESPQLEEGAVAIGFIENPNNEVGDRVWHIDLTQLIQESVDDMRPTLSLLLSGLSQANLELSLSTDSDNLAPGVVAKLKVFYSRTQAVPITKE